MNSSLLYIQIPPQRHIQARRNQLRVNLNWTAEAKVLSILTYYLILGAVVLTILTNSLTSVQQFFDEAVKYFGCQAKGIEDDEFDMGSANSTLESGNFTCDRTGIDGVISPIPTMIAFILLGLYPTVNLLYIVNLRELRKRLTCREERREVVRPDSNRGNIQSVHYRPVMANAGGNNYHQTSSLSERAYERPSTFRPLPPTPPPRLHIQNSDQ